MVVVILRSPSAKKSEGWSGGKTGQMGWDLVLIPNSQQTKLASKLSMGAYNGLDSELGPWASAASAEGT